MKTKIRLCLALVLNGALTALCSGTDGPNSLRVVVKPAKSQVRVNEGFKVALRVENPAETNQTVRVMSCSWCQEWKASDPRISWSPPECAKNLAISIKIPPHGVYTNELEMSVLQPIAQKTLSFRMGFTSIDSMKTFWSDAVTISIAPPK